MDANQPQPPDVKRDPPKPFVRRLRPTAVGLLLTALGLLVAAVLLIGLFNSTRIMDRSNERQTSSGRGSDRGVEGGPFGGLPTDYTYAIPQESPPVEAPPPAPPLAALPAPPDPELLKRLEALRRELQAAIDSPPVFASVRARTQAIARSARSPTNAFTGPEVADADEEDARQSGNLEFLRQASSIDSYVRSRLQRPRSKYELKAGAVIPGALLTAINSDLPGTVLGQVTDNVYDSITGEYLLIPQGARLLGAYNSEVLNGQNRILIVWQRLILPNGDSIVLEAMPGADRSGAAGLQDRVDHHPLRLTAAVLLSTVIAYTGNLAGNDRRGRDQLSIVGQTLAQESARVGQRVIDRELDVPPTITVRAGWPFHVLVNKDLPLRPYESRPRR